MTRKKFSGCRRCGKLSRKKLCDTLGDAYVFVDTIEHILKDQRWTSEYKLERIKEAMELMEEASEMTVAEMRHKRVTI